MDDADYGDMSSDLSKKKVGVAGLDGKVSRTVKIIFLAVAVLFAMGAPVAHGNPDVWVKAGATYRFEDGKVTGISFEWKFDQYFSSRTMRTYDADQSGVLEPKEIEHLRSEAFDPLKKFDYYVHIWVGAEKRENPSIDDFSARFDDKKLVYRFTIALTPPADPAAGDIVASLYDEQIYVDFRFFKKNFLLVEGAMSPGCKFRIARGKGAQSGHPQPVTLKCGGST